MAFPCECGGRGNRELADQREVDTLPSVVEFAFQNLHGNLLRLNGVIVFGRKSVSLARFDSRSFLFGVAISREKLIHFSLKCHCSVPFLCADSDDGLLKAQMKGPTNWASRPRVLLFGA